MIKHPLVSTLCILLYPTATAVLVWLIWNGQYQTCFNLACALIFCAIVITIASMRRYRQRLNYVEGLDREASQPIDNIDGLTQISALKPSWIDLLGDRGVGLVSVSLLVVVVPSTLTAASHIEGLRVFQTLPPQFESLDLSSWIAFVAIESVGFIKLLFDYFGMNRLQEIGHLGEHFTPYWQWFMALVQVGLISLAFDVFRRYLDLSTTLDRLTSTALIAADEALVQETEYIKLARTELVDSRQLRAALSEHDHARNRVLARVDTLARFLTVFPRRRMINTLIRAIIAPEQSRFQVPLTDEGRRQLLNSLQLSGSRMNNRGLAARITQQLALRLLHTHLTPLPLRRAALDALGGYHPLIKQGPYPLPERDRIEAVQVARDQLRASSANATSDSISIEYEQLIFASSYTLTVRGERTALSSLVAMRFTDALLLRREGESRLYHLYLHLSESEQNALETILAVMTSSEEGDDLTTEKHLRSLCAIMKSDTSASDLLDLNLCQLLCSQMAHYANGAHILRVMVNLLEQSGLSSLEQIIWASIQRPDLQAHALNGLIEGLKCEPNLYKSVAQRIAFTLKEGTPQEVKKQLELCERCSDVDSSTFPSLFIDEISSLIQQLDHLDEGSSSHRTIRQKILNLILGLSVSHVAMHRDLLDPWLTRLSQKTLTLELHKALQLLRAQLGEPELFKQIFAEYLSAIELPPSESKREISVRLIHTLDPDIEDVEGEWLSLLNEAKEGSPNSHHARAREIIETLQSKTSPVKLAWLIRFLEDDVHHSLKGQLILLFRNRLRHIRQGIFQPLTFESSTRFIFEYVKKKCLTEGYSGTLVQWVRTLGEISVQSGLSIHIEEASEILYALLDRSIPEVSINAQVMAVAAETLGTLGQRCNLDVSDQLINRYEQTPYQASKTGIIRALHDVGDEASLQFLTSTAAGTHSLNQTAFDWMVRALHRSRDLSSLTPLLSNAQNLTRAELNNLLNPFSIYRYPSGSLKDYLNEGSLNTLRVLICEILNDEASDETTVASVVSVIPLLFTEGDGELNTEEDEIAVALFSAARRSSIRPIDCLKITQALATTFPQRYMENFDEILEHISHHTPLHRVQWVLGLEHSDPDRMVNQLLEIAKDPKHLRPNSVVDMCGPLIKHGGARARRVVYEWISEFPMVGYSIIYKIGQYGSPEQDNLRLKDELYRARRLIQSLTRDQIETYDRVSPAARLFVNLLNTLYQFGERSCFAELVQLAISPAERTIDREIKSHALKLLPESVSEILTAELED